MLYLVQKHRVTPALSLRSRQHVYSERYQIPYQLHLSEKVIPELYESTKNDMKMSLSQAECVAMTTDGWTPCSNQGYMTISSHHIDPERNIKTRDLNEDEIQGSAKGGTDVGTLSESDIANMEHIVQLMGPVKMATTVMCEEEQLKHIQPLEDDSTLVAKIKRVMAND